MCFSFYVDNNVAKEAKKSEVYIMTTRLQMEFKVLLVNLDVSWI